jgi:hypothetical protein
VAVKQVRVSDLSGRQATEEQFAKLIVHQHPQYQGPITLDVLPEELGELPDSDQYVSIEVIGPGERSGQRAVLSVERLNQLAAGGDMHTILMDAVAAQQPHRAASPRRRGRGRGTGDSQARDGRTKGRGRVEWGLPHVGASRPRKPPGCASTWMRSSGCGRSGGCRCWIRATPGPSSATACNLALHHRT